MDKTEEIIESLSPIERKILPFLSKKSIKEISIHSGIDETSTLRALKYLENKGIVKLSTKKTKVVDLGDNGIIYTKNSLPERRLLNLLDEKKSLFLNDAKKLSKLSDNEFKAALGALKGKALIEVKENKIILNASREEIIKKSFEEQLLDLIKDQPANIEELLPEQILALKTLEKRKEIIHVRESIDVSIEITELGKKLASEKLSDDSIEQLTPEVIKSGIWQKKKFRRYDVISPVPKIYGGKKHFVSQAIEYAKRIWTEMGFKEMSSSLTQTSFWNFDALFQPQDHPVRDMHDTFFIKDMKGKLPDKKLVKAVRESHEKGVAESKGWQYSWKEDQAEKVILRTHTTCLSAKTLYSLSSLKDKKGKFFSVGRNFRNETVDWSHGFEFNQTEGIVIDTNANFTHLLGYLKEFFEKMGIKNIRFTPSYFPYTEPSVEISAFNNEKKIWFELGGAGIFRPEMVVPLLGEFIPVLAWGPGFDRMIMDYYEIKDLRDFYKNDLSQLRKIKNWLK